MKAITSYLIIIFISISINAQDTSLLNLKTQLDKLNNEASLKKVFIKTDKDIYAPGEKVWFKTEVMNAFTQKRVNSSLVVVTIKTDGGDIIADGKFVVANGAATGQVTIPGWATEGNAFVIAYHPNSPSINDASLLGIKPITINQLRRNDYLLDTKVDKKIYKLGDEIKLQVFLNPLSPSARKERVTVALYDYYKKISVVKENLKVNDINILKFKVPSEIENGLYFIIESTGKAGFSRRLPVYTTKDRLNIEFFVEGKNLLLNNNQRIIYRANDPFGNPIDVTGDIFDEMGNHAGMGRTLKKGLGVINIMPLPYHEYTFKVNSEYGKGQKFALPLATSNGTAFTLVKTEENALRAAVLNTGNMVGKSLTLTAIAQGEILMAQDFTAEQKNSFLINTEGFPLGIVNFVIIDTNGSVVSERLVFNYPNKDMDICIGTKVLPTPIDKQMEVVYDINDFTAQFGNASFDIKIVDIQNLYGEQEPLQYNFLQYPLFTPTPKNMLDHYLTSTEMIANRFTHFCIQDVMNNIDLLPKQASNYLSGYVTDRYGQRAANATVILVRPDNPSVATTLTNANGEFSFNGLAKTQDMLVKAVNETGKKNLSVHLHRSLYESLEEQLMQISFKNLAPYPASSSADYFTTNEHLLKLAGSETKDRKPAENNGPVKMLQSGASMIDVIRMIKPFTISGNKIIFAGGLNSLMMQDGALIVIDGQKMGTSITALDMVNPYDVVSINVSTDPIDIQQYTAFNTVGIIEINTRGNNSLSRIGKPVNEAKKEVSEFNADEIPKNIFRYQTTLYWEPNAQADDNGIIRRKFTLSEHKTDFVVIIEAHTPNGIVHVESTIVSTKD